MTGDKTDRVEELDKEVQHLNQWLEAIDEETDINVQQHEPDGDYVDVDQLEGEEKASHLAEWLFVIEQETELNLSEFEPHDPRFSDESEV